jgi:hypothetical protein
MDTETLVQRVRELDKVYARENISRKDYYEQRGALEAKWMLWLATENEVTHLSDEAQSAIYGYAFEEGHASGYSEVGNVYSSVAAIARIAAQ